ncbi:Nik-related protein kinase OS=Homo sapiens GN=NRK PE=1 SV=2 [Rhizoctonia solani AG-1 IB]|uniref:Nik-related protein kinase n=2 Tax=Thanatephorus cucumeris (strain AG1-IB / isolate 7/3/14) TaxID=1108050 RepID=A0A0B7FH40_THACB|nr:Nik-related protein kinase OS=Homo sapiens GN=NRK PE=1 SV=2 [Rhizoctonia solani AG-1 IB]
MSASYLPPEDILDLALRESSDGPPDPPALNRTTGLYPFNEDGASSQMFRCIVKRPHADQPLSFASGQGPNTGSSEGTLTVQRQSLDDVVKQFAAELRVFRTIGIHKNVVRFFGAIEGVGLVLEEIDHGHTLLELLPTLWNDSTKIDWFNQILEGLAHIHKFGLSHGDLSCTNIMVRYNVVKILDFGHSTYIGEEAIMGTPPFCAPEILRSDKGTDGRLGDAYSLGIVLIYLERGIDEDVISLEDQLQDKPPQINDLKLFTNLVSHYTLPKSDRWAIQRTHHIKTRDDD